MRSPPRSILVVMLSALGDAITVLPVVTALRRAYPGARISWVLQPGPRELVGDHPAVDEFILFRRGPRARNPAALLAGLKRLRTCAGEIRKRARSLPGERFDLLLALQVYLKAGILTGLSPARVKLGFDAYRARDLNGFFVTHRIPKNPDGFAHIQDQYFEFLHVLGVTPEPLDYRLAPTQEERRDQTRFFSGIHRPVCGIVVGTSDPRKNWRADAYARIVDDLTRRYRVHPILLGGPAERDRRMIREILARSRLPSRLVDANVPDGARTEEGSPPITCVAGDGLRRLLWLLDGCDLVISPDTGPLHVARALDVPVIGLYGYTNPARYGPYRKYTELVVDGYARTPEEEYGPSMERRSGGMDRVTPSAVLEKVELALERYVR